MSYVDNIDFDLLGGFLIFGMGIVIWLALVYVFNYALVTLFDNSGIVFPTAFLPAYRIINMCWTAIVPVGIIKFYILARKHGGPLG